MATYNKFEQFVEDVADGAHNLSADNIDWYLSNATPSASADAVKADLAEISTGNGYTAGGVDTQNTGGQTSGTYTLTGTAATITASGGAIAQFRYVVLFNDTPSTPADPLIGWHDYGSALDLASGESITLKPDDSASTGDLLTIA